MEILSPYRWALLLILIIPGCAADDRGRSSSSSDPALRRLRVMAYNIKHGRGMDGQVDLARIAQVIRDQAPDVVLLQEVDDRCGRSGSVDEVEVLGRALGMRGRHGKFMDYDGGRYGMAILSRLPIREFENVRLPDGAEPRTAIVAAIELDAASTVVVAGIHFYRTEAERLAQASRLLDRLANETRPVILAGDFNSRPGKTVMTHVERQFRNVPKAGSRLTFPSDRPDREIDYILVRPATAFSSTRCRVVEEILASDHRPLVADLVLQ